MVAGEPPVDRDAVVARALELGWAAAGVAGLGAFAEARARTLEAIDAGRMAGMNWMSRERVDAAADLGRRYPWARAIISLAWAYRPAASLKDLAPGDAPMVPPGGRGRPRGRMAAYATLPGDGGRPEDYHEVMGRACDDLVAWLAERVPGLRAKRFIDHGWALDRPIAERAGLGFAGKNTTLLTVAAGSYVLLAAVLVSAELEASRQVARNCGTCSACLPSCPTGALLEPGVLDARRCISYLTIEHRGAIPMELRPLMGTWIFGCDLCQEACPINQRLAPAPAPDPGPSTAAGPVPFPDLVQCLGLADADFDERFRGTAVWRTGRAGLARNAAIALGNAGDPRALPALHRARAEDPDDVVREAAAWAIARLGSAVLDEKADLVEVVPPQQV